MSECTQSHPACAKNLGVQAGRFCTVCGQSVAMSGGAPAAGSSHTSVQISTSTGNSRTWNYSALRANLIGTLRADNSKSDPIDIRTIIQVIGGILTAVGLLALVSELFLSGDSSSFFPAGLILIAATAGLTYLAEKQPTYQSAITAASVVLLPVGCFFLLESTISDGKPAWAFLLAGVLFLLLWFLPGLCGRPSLLAASLLAWSIGLITLAAQSYLNGLSDYLLDYTDQDIWIEVARQATALAILIGIACLIVGLKLDLRGWKKLATVFIGTGVLNATVGVLSFGQSRDLSDTSTAIFIAIYGIVLILLAVSTGRKATSWIAIGVASISIIALSSALLGESSDGAAGVILVGVGGLLVVMLSPRAHGYLTKIPFLQRSPSTNVDEA
jgi:hypothetical protein